MKIESLIYFAALVAIVPVSGLAQSAAPDVENTPVLAAFMGEGPGVRHPKAPAEIEQFGRLAGVWSVEVEMRAQDGSWVKSAPGTWLWKYDLNGFAVRDLWYQGADNLPMYMAGLGRDYLLTANRIYDVAGKKWRVAWMANGAGQAMGADFGTFTALLEGEQIVMTSTPGEGGFGQQRVIFDEFSDDSFRWRSEYSTDEGKTWNAVMRMRATRRARP